MYCNRLKFLEFDFDVSRPKKKQRGHLKGQRFQFTEVKHFKILAYCFAIF